VKKWSVYAVGIVLLVAVVGLGSFISSTDPPDPPVPLDNQALAYALGDHGSQGSVLGPHVHCVSQTGRTSSGRAFDRVCHEVVFDSIFCVPGTGVTRSTVLVEVKGQRYKVLGEQAVGEYTPCDGGETL
jgi:hypothetical protein